MKARKTSLIATMVLVAVCFLTISAWAGEYVCSVEEVGQGNPRAYVRLTDTAPTPDFTNMWFKLPVDRANEMLAVALTAISMNMNVHVWCSGTEYSEIWNMYLTKE